MSPLRPEPSLAEYEVNYSNFAGGAAIYYHFMYYATAGDHAVILAI